MLYHLVTLGCQMNKSDSERIQRVLETMGFQWTENEEEASLLGVIACSVRQKSIDKVYSKIQKWNKWKNKKNLITFASGCILPADREKFLKLFDLVFEPADILNFPELLSTYGISTPYSIQKRIVKNDENIEFTNSSEKIYEFWDIEPLYSSKFEAFIPIQNGCDKFCAFCAVPYTRGREISRPSDEIIDEFKCLINHNFKTITLLGQNVNSYGLDKKGNEITFPELLRKIGEIGDNSGKELWVYFTSPHPKDMTDEVIDIISKYKCLAKQIHLPLQSGDDEVLKRMNRKYTLDDYRKIIYKIRNTIPEATIFTDIIVGFPGETDEQFENTRKAMEEFKFNMAYIARYSPRPGALSSRWKDDIPYNVKTKRLEILTNELTKHSLEYNKSLIGKILRTLVTGKDRKNGYLSGITEGKIVLRFKSNDDQLIGNFVDIKITSATEYSLEGELV